jgi:hypothetical protein
LFRFVGSEFVLFTFRTVAYAFISTTYVHCFSVLVVLVQTKTTANGPGFWFEHVGFEFVFFKMV